MIVCFKKSDGVWARPDPSQNMGHIIYSSYVGAAVLELPVKTEYQFLENLQIVLCSGCHLV